MAGVARKHPIEEVDRLDLLTRPVPNASLHGAVTLLSPVKKGRNSNYFDGTLYDGHRQVRTVGFLPAQQKKLDGFWISKKAVAVKKPSRQGGDQMEVILKTSTEITAFPRDLDASVFTTFEPQASVISLSKIGSFDNYEKVIADVKVLTMMEPINVLGGKRKRDVTVGDQTGTARVTLWQEHVDSVEVEGSYRLKTFVVRECASQKYLSMPRAGAVITPIDNIGDVVQPVSKDITSTEIFNVEIIGVPQLDCYKACLKYKARVEPLTLHLGKCSKLGCAMMQCYDRCLNHLSAKLMVAWVDHELGIGTQLLFAYRKIVSGIVGIGDDDDDAVVSNELLLSSGMISSIRYNENNVIAAFSRSRE